MVTANLPKSCPCRFLDMNCSIPDELLCTLPVKSKGNEGLIHINNIILIPMLSSNHTSDWIQKLWCIPIQFPWVSLRYMCTHLVNKTVLHDESPCRTLLSWQWCCLDNNYFCWDRHASLSQFNMCCNNGSSNWWKIKEGPIHRSLAFLFWVACIPMTSPYQEMNRLWWRFAALQADCILRLSIAIFLCIVLTVAIFSQTK